MVVKEPKAEKLSDLFLVIKLIGDPFINDTDPSVPSVRVLTCAPYNLLKQILLNPHHR